MRTLVILCLVMGATAASGQVLDRIAAVVGDQFILESEVAAQMQFFILNNKIDPKTPGLRDEVLQNMINEKLIVERAIDDSVVVTDDEVQQQLDEVIRQRVAQVGSEARLEELYGMPIARIKREYRDEMRRNILANKLQQQRFGASQISRRDVEAFFAKYQDSLGTVPAEVELARIYVEPKFTDAQKGAARAKLQLLLDSLHAGVPFADLAARHSQDPGSASSGGDLGFVRRGQFVREFETAVYALKEGEISPIVETKFGFHIIQLVERRGDAVHARHILYRVERTQANSDSAIVVLDTLRARVLAGASFAELAKKYSEDKETAIIGGNLGTTDLDHVDKNLAAVIDTLKEGQISAPAPLGEGFQIVLMKRRTPAHPVSLDEDYHRLETLALNFKRSREYTQWIEELRKGIYWRIL